MTGQKEQEGYELTRPSFANNTPTKGIMQRYDYIPLDGFKFELIGVDITGLYERFCGLFKQGIEQGDEVEKSTHTFEGVTLTIFPSGYTTLKGSFHKFHNQGEHNYNDFDFNAFSASLTRLCNYFGVTPQNLRIVHLEYGFNVLPPMPTKDILQGLIQHKGKDFEYMTINGTGNYKQAIHDRYIFKVYDKRKQYNLKTDLLRIEVKIKNWTEHRAKGIETIYDFLKVDKKPFLQDILNNLNEVILYDKSIKGIDRFDKYSNSFFWRDTRDKRSSKTFNKHRHRLNELSKTKGSNLIECLKQRIIEKNNELQGVTDSNVLRKCELTGVDISMQREDSKLLSHTGLYNLIEQNPKEFDRIKRRFLNSHWFTKDIQTQVKEIAHNIRSRYNHRTRLQRHGQRVLF